MNPSRSHSISSAAAALFAACASFAPAQDYPTESSMRFQVWDGSAWTQHVTINPGSRVEWRITLDYTGPRTDLFGLGTVQYQPTLENVDNLGTGAAIDDLAPWRSELLSAQEGASGDALPTYGKVVYGPTNNGLPFLQTYRASNGQDGYPPGTWLRVGGVQGPSWPAFPLTSAPGADAINRIQRGVLQQGSPAIIPGVHNLVIFRGAFLASTDAFIERDVTLSTFRGSLRRAGGPTSTDDRRYLSYTTSSTDNGSYRVDVEFVPATITVVPTPGVGAVLTCAFSVLGVQPRRRRSV